MQVHWLRRPLLDELLLQSVRHLAVEQGNAPVTAAVALSAAAGSLALNDVNFAAHSASSQQHLRDIVHTGLWATLSRFGSHVSNAVSGADAAKGVKRVGTLWQDGHVKHVGELSWLLRYGLVMEVKTHYYLALPVMVNSAMESMRANKADMDTQVGPHDDSAHDVTTHHHRKKRVAASDLQAYGLRAVGVFVYDIVLRLTLADFLCVFVAGRSGVFNSMWFGRTPSSH